MTLSLSLWILFLEKIKNPTYTMTKENYMMLFYLDLNPKRHSVNGNSLSMGVSHRLDDLISQSELIGRQQFFF